MMMIFRRIYSLKFPPPPHLNRGLKFWPKFLIYMMMIFRIIYSLKFSPPPPFKSGVNILAKISNLFPFLLLLLFLVFSANRKPLFLPRFRIFAYFFHPRGSLLAKILTLDLNSVPLKYAIRNLILRALFLYFFLLFSGQDKHWLRLTRFFFHNTSIGRVLVKN